MAFDRRGFMRATESRQAYGELMELLAAVDTEYLSEKRRITRASDIAALA